MGEVCKLILIFSPIEDLRQNQLRRLTETWSRYYGLSERHTYSMSQDCPL